MNQEFQTGPGLSGQGGFAQVDADAVCEQCGTVNEEGTLLCKVCGQNLRDQRAQRLAAAAGVGPEGLDDRISRVRLFTGLLSVLGLLVIVLAVLNISKIEASLVQFLISDSSSDDGSLWTGDDSLIYDQLLLELEEYPTSPSRIEGTLENPVNEQSYNGRYLLVLPGLLESTRVVGEANLSRRGDKVYFAAKLTNESIDIRGYAILEESPQDGVVRPVARDTAGFLVDGIQYVGRGFADQLEEGGHRVMVSSSYGDEVRDHRVVALRVR